MRAKLFAFSLVFVVVTSVSSQQTAPTPSPLQQKADSLFLASDYAKAIPAYEAFFKKDVTSPISWNRYGFSLQKTGAIDKAATAYQRALDLKPTGGLLLIVLSRVAMIHGMKNEVEPFFATIDSMIRAGYADITGYDTTSEYASMKTDPRYATLRPRVESNAFPCRHNPKFRLFDFWIGEWVVNPTATPATIAGWSKIEMMAGGCGILENWTSNPAGGAASGPFEGKSINYFDSARGGWQQYWVGSAPMGTPMLWFYNGQYDENLKAMVFETDPGPGPNGEKQLGRLRFFNQGTDQVRQWSESSTDYGATWVTSYDFTYKRKK